MVDGSSYSLRELGYNPQTGVIRITIVADTDTEWESLREIEEIGNPLRRFLEVRFTEAPQISYKVKFVVAFPDSAYHVIQYQSEASAAIAADKVTHLDDGRTVSLELLSKNEIRDLGVTPEAARLLNKGRSPFGISAALYRDYTAGPQSYILAFGANPNWADALKRAHEKTDDAGTVSVSYTHLTLPTICSV